MSRLPYPHDYPELLWYKAKAGIKDVIGEMRGVISTKEKFEKERSRMAKHVWAEYKETNSANCRTCHAFTKEVVTKQKESGAGDAPDGPGRPGDVYRLPQGPRAQVS
jgi:cytochrome c-type protein NapC